MFLKIQLSDKIIFIEDSSEKGWSDLRIERKVRKYLGKIIVNWVSWMALLFMFQKLFKAKLFLSVCIFLEPL